MEEGLACPVPYSWPASTSPDVNMVFSVGEGVLGELRCGMVAQVARDLRLDGSTGQRDTKFKKVALVKAAVRERLAAIA